MNNIYLVWIPFAVIGYCILIVKIAFWLYHRNDYYFKCSGCKAKFQLYSLYDFHIKYECDKLRGQIK